MKMRAFLYRKLRTIGIEQEEPRGRGGYELRWEGIDEPKLRELYEFYKTEYHFRICGREHKRMSFQGFVSMLHRDYGIPNTELVQRLIVEAAKTRKHKYYLAHKERMIKAAVEWRENNPERYKEIEREYQRKRRNHNGKEETH